MQTHLGCRYQIKGRLTGDNGNSTWHEDCDGCLHSLADDIVQSEHPVRFDVVVSQHFVHLKSQRRLFYCVWIQSERAVIPHFKQRDLYYVFTVSVYQRI